MIDQYIYTYLGAQSAISNIVSTRIYPEILPADPTYPAITIRAESHDYVQSFSGNTGLVKSSYMIDAWSSTHAGAITLANAIRTTLKNYSGAFGGILVQQIHVEQGPFFVYEDAVEAYRATQVFSIWHGEG